MKSSSQIVLQPIVNTINILLFKEKAHKDYYKYKMQKRKNRMRSKLLTPDLSHSIGRHKATPLVHVVKHQERLYSCIPWLSIMNTVIWILEYHELDLFMVWFVFLEPRKPNSRYMLDKSYRSNDYVIINHPNHKLWPHGIMFATHHDDVWDQWSCAKLRDCVIKRSSIYMETRYKWFFRNQMGIWNPKFAGGCYFIR